jgi:outer membrane biosynthesis protein TonB
MSAAFSARDQRALQRADDRRLSIALGASLVIHALVIAFLRGFLPTFSAYPEAGAGAFTALQAVLAGPKTEPTPEPEPVVEPVAEPALLSPPAANPSETQIRRPPPQTSPQPGGNPARVGPNTPEVSVAVGTIDDPAKLGPDYVARLAQRFPQPAMKPPLLLGSPIVVYPQAALEAGTERRVAVLLTLRADGTIAETQLVREDTLFGPPVLDALKGTQFSPAEIDGQPVPYWAIVEFVFSLGGARAPPLSDRSYGRRGSAYSYPRYPSVGR